jgi:hypothetical protein
MWSSQAEWCLMINVGLFFTIARTSWFVEYIFSINSRLRPCEILSKDGESRRNYIVDKLGNQFLIVSHES